MKSLEFIFFVSFFILFYSYFGYGIMLFVIVKLKSLFKKSKSFDKTYEPEITLVVPCYNEAYIIEQKISNSLDLEYPKSKLNLVFVTDGSTDSSMELLSRYPSVTTFHISRRSGKTAAENRVMQFINTPIVVFTDANTLLNKEALRNLVKHFSDDKVGCVSGEKRIFTKTADVASAAGEGMYWKYESVLKKLDYQLNSAVGAAGELVAYRTELFEQLPEDTILDDFTQSMIIASKGYKIAYEPKAYAIETASESVGEELKRKIRISAGGWQSIDRLGQYLSCIKSPLLYFQYFSHRVLRWTITPFLLIILFAVNWPLAMHSHFYKNIFMCHIMFYVCASAGFLLQQKNIKIKAFFIPYYFFIMNYAVVIGLIRFLNGSQSAVWEKNKRMDTSINHRRVAA